METAMEIVQTTLQETTTETIIKTQQVSGDNLDWPISLFFCWHAQPQCSSLVQKLWYTIPLKFLAQTLFILHVVANDELLLAFYFILIPSQVMVTGMVIALVIVSVTTMETQTETTTSTHTVSNSLIAYLSLMCPIMCAAAALYLTLHIHQSFFHFLKNWNTNFWVLQKDTSKSLFQFSISYGLSKCRGGFGVGRCGVVKH